MQYRRSGFLIIICLLLSFVGWGQSIQPAQIQPAQESPAQNAPTQNAPAQNIPIQPDSPMIGGSMNGGDFSTVTHPKPEAIVPKDTIIVKGAWSSASDSTTPLPEAAALTNNVFTDEYFGITYPLPSGWMQKFTPPPPSDSGRYVLAQLGRSGSFQLGQSDSSKGENTGSIMFTAQDMFFTPLPVANARQFVNYSKNHLPEYYQVELKPTQTTIGGQSFTFFAYWSPDAELHWYVLATQIRCHALEIVLMSRNSKALQDLVLDMSNKMKLPAEASSTGGTGGGNVPVCIKDYAAGENVLERVEPVFPQQRHNPVPVRIIIDKEGKVTHIHFLSAYPEQQNVISDALKHWKFRPFERNGQRFEVETGIMFGAAPPAVLATDRAMD
ncbi:MAG: energy transducer TonB [Acidobacteriia bacterium]|nr:energy transducer TonB [Terriglobia bacterium]